MGKMIECVPNFSEGRRQDVIDKICAPFRGREGVYLLDQRADPDHNRLVVSVAGQPDPICDALIEASRVAIKHIDLREHRGEHLRMGAIDVVPFTPLHGFTIEDCVAIARSFGERLCRETGVPVYYYEEAATRSDRKRLEMVRKGEFESLCSEASSNPDRCPDICSDPSKPCLHPSAGATAVGARKFLIAFNVNLATNDLAVAKAIAAAVRASSGGLAHVKGLGMALTERGIVQVSMNIVDHEKNPLYRVLEMIRMEAHRWGVQVLETEIYGMVPARAMLDGIAYYMQTAGFKADQVIDLRLLELMAENKQ